MLIFYKILNIDFAKSKICKLLWIQQSICDYRRQFWWLGLGSLQAQSWGGKSNQRVENGVRVGCFCFKDMAATESAFKWVTVAYNLMNLFRITAYNSDVKHVLKTMKFNCIAIGAYLVRHSRRTVLKMCVNQKRRSFFDQIFQRIIVYENPKVVTCEIAHLSIAWFGFMMIDSFFMELKKNNIK